MLKTKLLYSDRLFDIFAIEVNGECFVKNFVNGLQESDRKKFVRLLTSTAQNGLPLNTEKFKKLFYEAMNIYEFKSKPHRILCTLDGDREIILSHGFQKVKRGRLEIEINKAVKYFEQYFKGKQHEKGK